jgi:hypothetical protein
MNNKFILTVCLILVVHSAIVSTDTFSNVATNLELNKFAETLRIPTGISDVKLPITQDADVYFGNVEINIDNGDKKRIDFFGTFVPNKKNCSYSRCFYGWVDNYTISG